LPCGSINAHERPWALKHPPINYEPCCIDRLNPLPIATKFRIAPK
jgi:hypothetical protein